MATLMLETERFVWTTQASDSVWLHILAEARRCDDGVGGSYKLGINPRLQREVVAQLMPG